MDDLGLIGTIGEDDEVAVASESSDSDEEATQVKKKTKKKKGGVKTNKNDDFNDNFEFADDDEEFIQWSYEHMENAKAKQQLSLDEKIASVRRKKRKEAKEEDDSESEKEQDDASAESDTESSADEVEQIKDALKTKDKKKKKSKKGEVTEMEIDEEEEEKIEYSQEVTSFDKSIGFSDMNLSRPLLKAVTALGFTNPTPIQSATVPLALQGKDICACAATGTGKTAAFMLPILERLLYKPKQAPVTRVLVLTPTRELAVQIHQVSRQLAQYTNIDISLSAGGLDRSAQEAALRLGPDVVIATPGRLIDHLHNAPNFHLGSVEVLVLDEADRMLDEYFAEQMKEVIRLCSRTRQTMLFSATMTEQVKDLAAVSLSEPVKIFVNENTDVALNLRQEFVRIRENREGDREAVVAALLKRTFHSQCIVFLQTKRQAHRLHVLLGLMGVNVGELHGNLSQLQRLDALNKFKEGEIGVLLATDLVARGLDIENVKTVVNFSLPNTFAHYIHRVGRTARAGRRGRAISLVGEKERKLLKEIVKKANNPVKSRVIPPEVINKYRTRIRKLEKDVEEIEAAEEEEKAMRATENQMNKAQRLLLERQAVNDPMAAALAGLDRKRTWFQTHAERKREQEAQRLTEFTHLSTDDLKEGKKKHKNKPQYKKPENAEERAELEIAMSQAYAARIAKRNRKEPRARACVEDDEEQAPASKKKKRGGTSFAKELTSTSQKALKKYRHGPDMSYQERKEKGMFKKSQPKGQAKGPGKAFKSKSRYKRK